VEMMNWSRSGHYKSEREREDLKQDEMFKRGICGLKNEEKYRGSKQHDEPF